MIAALLAIIVILLVALLIVNILTYLDFDRLEEQLDEIQEKVNNIDESLAGIFCGAEEFDEDDDDDPADYWKRNEDWYDK